MAAALILEIEMTARKERAYSMRWEVPAPTDKERKELRSRRRRAETAQPRTIKVGRHEFPEPIAEFPGEKSYCYCVMLDNEAGFVTGWFLWEGEGTTVEKNLLKNRLCHLTEEAAQAHADALNAICRGDID